MERDIFGKKHINHAFISTHTLTWSVTSQNLVMPIVSRYFNSHAHVERDPRTFTPSVIVVYFNSHAHVERDCMRYAHGTHQEYFNSHAHVERDCFALKNTM